MSYAIFSVFTADIFTENLIHKPAAVVEPDRTVSVSAVPEAVVVLFTVRRFIIAPRLFAEKPAGVARCLMLIEHSYLPLPGAVPGFVSESFFLL